MGAHNPSEWERPEVLRHNPSEWELREAASNIMSTTYDDDEGEI